MKLSGSRGLGPIGSRCLRRFKPGVFGPEAWPRAAANLLGPQADIADGRSAGRRRFELSDGPLFKPVFQSLLLLAILNPDQQPKKCTPKGTSKIPDLTDLMTREALQLLAYPSLW